MKKLSYRDRGLILGLVIFLILFAFYKYVYEPFETKASELKEKRDNLKIDAESKNVDVISSKIDSLEKQLKLEVAEKKEFEKQRVITKEQQEKLLLYIGEKANELDINLNKFEEKATQSSSSYNVVGYDIKARGESKNLILFLNSIYKFYNYCFITDVNLRKVEVSPTFETDKLDTLTNEEKQIINWDDDKINLILMDIPPLVVEKDTEDSEESEEEKEETPTIKELQLDFSLYFILSE